MENEKIRGLNHKKASEDQLSSCSVLGLASESLELSHYFPSPSHSWSVRVLLEHSSLEKGKGKQAKQRKINQGSRKGKKDQVALTGILASNLFHV